MTETTEVVVLDLRDAPGDQPTELTGGVVVLDNADSLVKHADTYMSLVGEDMVTAVVCVAVGESDAEHQRDGVVLAVPPALRHATVLWVGDPRGVDWALRGSHPRPVAGDHDALDDLVAALRMPTVFDRVVALREEMGGVAANPGIRVASLAADPAELAAAAEFAVRTLCDPSDPPSSAIGTALRQPTGAAEGESTVLSGPVAAARTAAARRLSQLNATATALGTAKALFEPSRPGERVGSEAEQAGTAAEHYRRFIEELLNRMDGQLQAERPPVDKVVELGVAAPTRARPDQVAEEVRQAVETRLAGGTSLPVLARELRLASATSAPQGCAAALAEVAERGPLGLELPPFRRWPLPLAALPLILVSSAIVAFLAGPGWLSWLAGGLLAAGWFASGWLLLARRPDAGGERGFGPSVAEAAVYGGAAVFGALLGAVATQRLAARVEVPELTGQFVTLAVVLLAAGTVVLSWRSAVRRWRAELRVDGLFGTLDELTRIAEEATVREWLPMRRHRAVASATSELAAAVEEIARTVTESGGRLFGASSFDSHSGHRHRPDDRPVPRDLAEVILGDLTDLCRMALEPAWPTARSARGPHEGAHARRLQLLIEEYGEHVQRHGLLAAPPFARDPDRRDALATRFSSDTPAMTAALRTGVDGDMTQLCRSGQLGYLSSASRPGLLRFAPRHVRDTLRRDVRYERVASDRTIGWTDDGELVGALRLVPLRAESVREVMNGGF